METTQVVSDDILKAHLETAVETVIKKAEIAYPEHIKEWNDKKRYDEMQRRMLQDGFKKRLTASKSEDGNIGYFVDGELQIDHNSGKLLSVEDAFNATYKNYLKPAPGYTPEQAAAAGESFLKSKTDVMKFLEKKFYPKGIKQGNAQWNQEYSRIIKQQNISE